MRDGYSLKTLSEQDVSKKEKTNTAVSKPSTSVRDRVSILLALLALYLIWGGTYLGMRIALQSFPPFIMAGVRFLIAGSVLYLFLRVRGSPAPTRAQWVGA